jgi:hypothetical protein
MTRISATLPPHRLVRSFRIISQRLIIHYETSFHVGGGCFAGLGGFSDRASRLQGHPNEGGPEYTLGVVLVGVEFESTGLAQAFRQALFRPAASNRTWCGRKACLTAVFLARCSTSSTYFAEMPVIRDAVNIIRDERFREQLMSIADQYDSAAAEIEKHIRSAVMTSDWGYRFLISGDEFVKASVFLVYGVQFARLLGLPEQPRSKVPLVHQLPVRYRPLFVDGYAEALRDLAPTRLSGTVVHQQNLELYRAAFMPIRGANSVRSLIFGSFNYRVLPQQAASDGLRSDKHDSHPGIAITWNEVTG